MNAKITLNFEGFSTLTDYPLLCWPGYLVNDYVIFNKARFLLDVISITLMKFLDNKRLFFINETRKQVIYICMCTVRSI